MIDAVHRDTIDRHRFEREAGDATLHGLTYSVADWRASEKCAVPQERFLYPSTPTQPVRASGFDSAVRQGTAQLRPYSTVPSARLQRLSLPEKETATRASKLLNSMTQDDWANFTKHGAPEAWQVARKGTKKGNTNLRRELAHISRLRDVHRRSGAMSVTPSFFSYDAASSPTRGMARYASGGMPGADGVEGPRTQAAAVKDLRGAPVEADRSRSATPAGMPLRPVTSMSITLQQAGPSSGRESPALTPNTIRRQHLTELMGTDSRPTSVYKVLKRRQPQAEFHMLWSVGPKRFDSYRQNAENELLAEKKADQAKRRLLIKQLRQKMQAACTNTKTLPRDLWDKFKVADDDGSGRLEFDEYCEVMNQCGLGVDKLGEEGLRTLYRVADKDGNGNIDFNEFLVAVVGNLVSI